MWDKVFSKSPMQSPDALMNAEVVSPFHKCTDCVVPLDDTGEIGPQRIMSLALAEEHASLITQHMPHSSVWLSAGGWRGVGKAIPLHIAVIWYHVREGQAFPLTGSCPWPELVELEVCIPCDVALDSNGEWGFGISHAACPYP